MRKEDGISIIALIFIILVLAIIAGFAYNKLQSFVTDFTENDIEYNKSEIVEKLNLIVKEKYIKDYKYAQENNKDINELYSSEAVVNYLIDSNYIEQLRDIDDRLVQDEYYINADSLNSDIATQVINENGSNSNGTKVFKIKKFDEKYMIYFVDKYGNQEEIGELNMKPEIK